MYAVIFKATIKELDEEYLQIAAQLRKLALTSYGCTEFLSYGQGQNELAISYWPSKEHIRAWKQATEHGDAQAMALGRWYQSYEVQIVEVQHSYAQTQAQP